MNSPRLILPAVFAALLFSLGFVAPIHSQQPGTRPLLTNGSFEKGLEGWQFFAHDRKGMAAPDAMETHAGKPSVRIDNDGPDDSLLMQKVSVKPATRYRLSGWIKTRDVGALSQDQPGSRLDGNGATLSVRGGFVKTNVVAQTRDWTRVTLEFFTLKETEIEVGPRLGHHGGKVSGTAWYAAVELQELGPKVERRISGPRSPERGKVFASAYLEENFRGEEYRIPVPTQVPNSTNLMRVLGLPTDRIASLKVPPGVQVTLYDHSAYGGVSERFTGDAPKLGKMNGLTSALKAEFAGAAREKTGNEAGSGIFFTVYLREDLVGPRFRIEVPAGLVDDAALRNLGIPNDSIGSLDIPAGVRVTLYDHKAYGGEHRTFEGRVPNLGIMKDTTSSLKAELTKKP
jgi:hypothetical protein